MKLSTFPNLTNEVNIIPLSSLGNVNFSFTTDENRVDQAQHEPLSTSVDITPTPVPIINTSSTNTAKPARKKRKLSGNSPDFDLKPILSEHPLGLPIIKIY